MALSGSLTFLSASVTGSANVKVDFVGLNTLVVDTVSASLNELGHSNDVDSRKYINSSIESISDAELNVQPNQLNSILLNRNGPYQHPTWKQYRGGDHPVARALRLNNTMSIDAAFPDAIKREEQKRRQRDKLDNMSTRELSEYYTTHNKGLEKLGTGTPPWPTSNSTLASASLKQYYEPVLTTKHKPLVYSATTPDGDIKVRASLMNNMTVFSNDKLNEALKFSAGDPTTGSAENVSFKPTNHKMYRILHMATDYDGKGFVYSERLFPREINSYRDYKLERPGYEQVAGQGENGYDKLKIRLFWKYSQGPLATGNRLGGAPLATSDGTSRFRTDSAASNSMGHVQHTTMPQIPIVAGTTVTPASRPKAGMDQSVLLSSFSSSARQLISSSLSFITAAYQHQYNATTAYHTGSYSVNLTTRSLDLGLQGLTVEYIDNGIVINRYQSLPSKPAASGSVEALGGSVSGAVLFQLDSYQPYNPSLLSSWPLDPRSDIYYKPPYLTSSLGGKGLQIGLTPHRNSTIIAAPIVHDGFLRETGAEATITSSIMNSTRDLYTGSAGELVYSTKPTIFFWRNSISHHTSSLVLSASHPGPQLLFANVAEPEEKFELQDAQGHRVGFHYITGTIVSDGRTVNASGSKFVQIGMDKCWTTQTLMERTRDAINNVNSYGNGLTLNVTAALHSSASSVGSRTDGADGDSPHLGAYYAGHLETRLHIMQTVPGLGQHVQYISGSSAGIKGVGAGGGAGQKTIGFGHGSPSFHLTKMTMSVSPLHAGTTASLFDDAVMGYKHPTSSLQYNRHTFPYNTPFYATNRIRQRDPLYNSYNTYADNFKQLGRDFSVIPEFRYSEHLDYYHRLYDFGGKKDNMLYGNHHVASSVGTEMSSVKFLRLNFLSAKYADFLLQAHKADFLTLDGASISSSANAKKYSKSSTRYEYDDINGAQLLTTDAESDYSYFSDQVAVDFYGKYGITDSTINFSHLLDQQNRGFAEDTNTVPSKIEFKCQALKKLLPYNGFYPMLHTVQIGTAFKKEFARNDYNYTGTMDQQPAGQGPWEAALEQALLEPFVAPGLLYNSIKSGIAVDYPIYFEKPRYYIPNTFVAGADAPEFTPVSGAAGERQNTIYGVQAQSLSSSYHGGLYMMGASRCTPSILTSTSSVRLPFKALYDVERARAVFAETQAGNDERPFTHLVSDFVDLDRSRASVQDLVHHRSGTIVVGNPHVQLPDDVGFSALRGGTYYSLINNFLSETMEFFLADLDQIGTKLPVAMSGLKSSGVKLEDEKEYMMAVSLEMGKHQVVTEGPRSAGIGSVNGGIKSWKEATAHAYVQVFLVNAFNLVAGDQLIITDNLGESYRYITGGATSGNVYGLDAMIPATLIAAINSSGKFLAVADSAVAGTRIQQLRPGRGGITQVQFIPGPSNAGLPVSGYEAVLGSLPDGTSNLVLTPDGTFYGKIKNNGLSAQMAIPELAEDYFIRNSSMRGYVYGPPTEIVPHARSIVSSGTLWNNHLYEMKDSFIDKLDYSSYYAANLQDPAYHSYTPPYFYGKSSFVYRVSGSFSGDQSVTEIVNLTKQNGASFNVDRYDVPLSGTSADHRLKIDPTSLSIITPNSESVSQGSNVRMHVNSSLEIFGDQVPIHENDGNTTTISDVWCVAPEWICPVLDFSSSHTSVTDRYIKSGLQDGEPVYGTTITRLTNSFHDVTTGRGLWGGYGADPYDSHLIDDALEAQGIAEDKIETFKSQKGIYLEIKDFSIDALASDKQAQDSTYIKTATDSYFGTVGTNITADAESMADLLGFQKNARYEIGRMAENKTIHEGIVLIPYLEKPVDIKLKSTVDFDGGNSFDEKSVYSTREIVPGKHFLPIQERLFENILSLHIMDETMTQAEINQSNIFGSPQDLFSVQAANDSGATIDVVVDSWLKSARDEAINKTDVGKMIKQLSSFSSHGGWVLPPEFDFMHDKHVPPFQMIIVPFSHELQKQELIDIYQGILPDSGLDVQKTSESSAVNPSYNAQNGGLYIPRMPAQSAFGEDPPKIVIDDSLANFLSPRLFSNELIDGIMAGKLNDNTKRPYKTAREFYKNLRFMVFRVKKRAKKDYKNYRLSQLAKAVEINRITNTAAQRLEDGKFKRALKNRTVGDIYGANWPYDYFSLIETAKIDIEFEVED